MNHIGIDMSKDTFHAAFDEKKVRISANSKTGIAAFLQEMKNFGFKRTETNIGVESAGVYHSLFCHMLSSAGCTVFLINPLTTHRIIAAGSLQSVKNDRRDAIAIRHAVMIGKGYRFLEMEESGILRSLFREYSSMTLMKGMCK
jgi:transposase